MYISISVFGCLALLQQFKEGFAGPPVSKTDSEKTVASKYKNGTPSNSVGSNSVPGGGHRSPSHLSSKYTDASANQSTKNGGSSRSKSQESQKARSRYGDENSYESTGNTSHLTRAHSSSGRSSRNPLSPIQENTERSSSTGSKRHTSDSKGGVVSKRGSQGGSGTGSHVGMDSIQEGSANGSHRSHRSHGSRSGSPGTSSRRESEKGSHGGPSQSSKGPYDSASRAPVHGASPRHSSHKESESSGSYRSSSGTGSENKTGNGTPRSSSGEGKTQSYQQSGGSSSQAGGEGKTQSYQQSGGSSSKAGSENYTGSGGRTSSAGKSHTIQELSGGGGYGTGSENYTGSGGRSSRKSRSQTYSFGGSQGGSQSYGGGGGGAMIPAAGSMGRRGKGGVIDVDHKPAWSEMEKGQVYRGPDGTHYVDLTGPLHGGPCDNRLANMSPKDKYTETEKIMDDLHKKIKGSTLEKDPVNLIITMHLPNKRKGNFFERMLGLNCWTRKKKSQVHPDKC